MLALIVFSVYLLKAVTHAAPIPGTSETQFDASFFQWGRALHDSNTCGCLNPNNQRSLWDIIWSCLSVMFACTWVAVHPNMADPREGQWKVSVRRLKLMIWCLLAPEFMIMWAMKQWMGSRKIARFYKDRGWNMTHGFFLQMGGFMLYDGDKPHGLLWFDHLQKLDKEQCIEFPTITASEIEDRSKGDGLSKAFVILQTSWFIVQCIARKAQKLPITELELVALAFATLNGMIYVFWWNKPLNVRFPVHVQLKVPFNTTKTASQGVRHVSETPGSMGTKLEGIQSESTRSDGAQSECVQPEDAQIQDGQLQDTHPDIILQAEEKIVLEEEYSCPCQCIIPEGQNLKETEPKRTNQISLSVGSRKSPFCWLILTWNKFNVIASHSSLRILRRIRQTWIRVVQFWEETGDMGIFRSVNCMTGVMDPQLKNEMNKTPTYYALPAQDSQISYIWAISSVASMLFGAIHCCAWMSSFVTPIERELWRFGSATIVCVPFQLFLSGIPVLIFMRVKAARMAELANIIGSLSLLLGSTLYICARLILLVEAFIALRALPSAAYDTVTWTDFIPHI